MIKILYFMKLVDLAGCSNEEMKLPNGVQNVKNLVDLLEARSEAYKQGLQGGALVQITINKRFVELADAIQDGDEIAFFPKG